MPPLISTGSPASATLVASNGACTSTAMASFSLLPFSKISVLPTTATMCPGATLELQVSGAVSYEWQDHEKVNVVSHSKAIVNPDKSATFSVSGIDSYGGGTESASAHITVFPALSG